MIEYSCLFFLSLVYLLLITLASSLFHDTIETRTPLLHHTPQSSERISSGHSNFEESTINVQLFSTLIGTALHIFPVVHFDQR